MKFILLLLAVSLVVNSEGKPLEDIERKCIVKYLSDRELLDSSFEVEAVNSETCDELMNAKKSEIYADMGNGEQYPNLYNLKIHGTADLVLKSLLYGNSTEAEELMKTLQTFKEIIKLSEQKKELERLIDNTFSLEFQDNNATKKMSCLRKMMYNETLNTEDKHLKIKLIKKEYDCNELLSSIREKLEHKILDSLPKLSNDKEQSCMKKAYKDLNVKELFTPNLIYSSNDYSDKETNEYRKCLYYIMEYYESTLDCVLIGFLLKDAPTIRNAFSIDHITQSSIYKVNYGQYGLLVKFNPDRSHKETLIVADKNNNMRKISKCMSEKLEFYGFNKLALKTMSVEDDFDAARLSKMRNLLHRVSMQSKADCYDSLNVYNVFTKITAYINSFEEQSNCFNQTLTEDKVDGVTILRVNLDIPDEQKCIDLFKQAEMMANGMTVAFPVSEVFCLKDKSKEFNLFKRMWAIEVLKKYDVSEQQRMELTQDYNKLVEESKTLLIECYVEMSDDILKTSEDHSQLIIQ